MDFLTYYKQISSGNLNSIAVFTGDETYNIDHTLKYIEGHFLEPIYKDFNYDIIESNFDIDGFMALASTLPFMDQRRIIIIHNTGVLKQIKDQQEAHLIDYLKNMSETSVVIFRESELDGRKKIGKWLKKNSDWVQFDKLSSSDFLKWCTKKFKLYVGNIDSKTLSYFVERVDYLDPASGKNLYDVENTIKTLCGNQKQIQIEMIDQYVSVPLEHNIFKLMDAISYRNLSEAMITLNQFINAGEPVIKIFTLIAQQFRNIYKMKLLIEAGYTSSTAASKLDIHPYAAKKASTFAVKYTKDQLSEILALMERTDIALKSTGIKPQLTLEKALFEMAQM